MLEALVTDGSLTDGEIRDQVVTLIGAGQEPRRFDPDRFVDLSPEQRKLADAAWVAFGKGPRNCIGFALAQMELTLIVSRFAQQIDITTRCSDVPRPVGMVVNRPAGGAPMSVSLRRRS